MALAGVRAGERAEAKRARVERETKASGTECGSRQNGKELVIRRTGEHEGEVHEASNTTEKRIEC